jgi:hypothetical protein
MTRFASKSLAAAAAAFITLLTMQQVTAVPAPMPVAAAPLF